MKYLTIILLGFILLSSEINAQQPALFSKVSGNSGTSVDTSDYFPLHNGDYWEYAANSYFYGIKRFSWKVIGDTLMPNGKTYKIVDENHFEPRPGSIDQLYFRKDSNNVYRYQGGAIITGDEDYKYFDFTAKDSTIWRVFPDTTNNSVGNSRGIVRTYYESRFYDFFHRPLEVKLFNGVFVNSTDTIWGPGDGDFPTRIGKGLGMVWKLIFNDGEFFLQGALINGVKFGTLSSISKDENTSPGDFKIRAYPNPFNSTVTLNFNLINSGFTELSVYNILGQKIQTIFNEFRQGGTSEIKYNADNLGSGLYIVLLKQNERISKEKIILLK